MNNNVNIALAQSKGLVNENDYTKYNSLVNIYKYLFTKYLETKIDLQKYDNEILNSNLDFGMMPDNYRNDYQKNSYLNLNYIYIRNNFYVEKLNVEEINYLLNIDIDNCVLNSETINLIETTFRDVINDNYRHDKYLDNTNACYGSFIPSNIVDSKSLVLCIQYGKNTTKYTDEEYLKNRKMKQIFLDNLKNRIRLDFSDILDINTTVLIRDFVGEN